VAFPTETVYGLGADASNEKAVSRIYSVKGRPTEHPLIVHISSITQLEKWAVDIPDYAAKLARDFWPGPMTLILKRSAFAKDFITGGQNSIGLRVPNQSMALALINEFEKIGGYGVAAPSANRFGAVSPTNSAEVEIEIGQYLELKDIILNGGQCLIGIESTIIDCTNLMPIILRPGALTPEIILEKTQIQAVVEKNSSIRYSGSLERHYSPNAKVLLNQTPIPGQGLIALANFVTPVGVRRLASPRNIEEFAKLIYSSLREADQQNLSEVVVLEPQGNGLALAIRDRLRRA
jgi:L-threonylcarbamoyladenylate synthase